MKKLFNLIVITLISFLIITSYYYNTLKNNLFDTKNKQDENVLKKFIDWKIKFQKNYTNDEQIYRF
jgi:hypothetical protein